MKDRENIMNETKKRNLFYVLVAAVIAVVFFFAGFGTGYGVGKGADPAPDANAETEASGGMVISGLEEGTDGGTENHISLTSVEIPREEYDEYGITPSAQTVYRVIATVNGDGLTTNQKQVEWSAPTFKDPSSEWAAGKKLAEYFSIGASGRIVTIACLKPFGEQLIMTCKSTYNPAISRELTVDYVREPSAFCIERTLSLGEHRSTPSTLTQAKVYGKEYHTTLHLVGLSYHQESPSTSGSWGNTIIQLNPQTPMISSGGVGTVEDMVEESSFTFRYSDAFWTELLKLDTAFPMEEPTRKDFTDKTSSDQYSLLYGMGNNMEKYVGDSVSNGSHRGIRSDAIAFLELLDGFENAIECNYNIKSKYRGVTLTGTIYFTCTVEG